MGKCSPARSRRPISIIFGALESIFDASFGFGIFVLLNTIRIFGKLWILSTPHYSINGRLYAIWFNLWNSDSTFGYPTSIPWSARFSLRIIIPEPENLSGLLQWSFSGLRGFGEKDRGVGEKAGRFRKGRGQKQEGRGWGIKPSKPRRRLGKTSLAWCSSRFYRRW